MIEKPLDRERLIVVATKLRAPLALYFAEACRVSGCTPYDALRRFALAAVADSSIIVRLRAQSLLMDAHRAPRPVAAAVGGKGKGGPGVGSASAPAAAEAAPEV